MPAGGRLPSGESQSWPNEGGKEGQDSAKGVRERGWPAGGGEPTIHQGKKKNNTPRDFPGDPGVRTSCFHCG